MKPAMYPRIIREFEDERDEPMIYGGSSWPFYLD